MSGAKFLCAFGPRIVFERKNSVTDAMVDYLGESLHLPLSRAEDLDFIFHLFRRLTFWSLLNTP